MLVAGCTAAQESEATVLKPKSTVGVDSADGGRIVGLVVDEEQNPLFEAEVGLQGPGGMAAKALTDAAGGFAILGVEPGQYTLLATKLAYEPSAQQIIINAGDELTPTIPLKALAATGPYPKVQEQDGYLQCTVRVSPGAPVPAGLPAGWYTGVNTCGVVCIATCLPIWPEDKFALEFTVNETGTQELFLDMQWTSTQSLGKALSVVLEVPGHPNEKAALYGQAVGPSALHIYTPAARATEVWTALKLDCPNTGCKYATRVFGSANVTNFDIPAEPPVVPIVGAPSKRIDAGWVMDQKFQQFFTTFHNMEKPPEYSALT